MVHARNVKPPFAGAKLTGIDESSVRGMPGFIKVVSKGNYVAVVCEREEQAINASRQAQDHLGKAGHRAFPRLRRSVQLHSRRRADIGYHAPIDRGQSRRGIRGRGEAHRSRV